MLEGARHLKGTFFLKKKEVFSENRKGTSLFIAKSWGKACVQSAPLVLTSMYQSQKSAEDFLSWTFKR